MIRVLSKAVAVLGAAFLAVSVASCDVPSEDGGTGWVGTYKTVDTQDNPMEIVLKDDGVATGSRADENLTGSWKAEEGDAVVITWGDGWTTKIAKDGDGYKKSTWEGAMEGDPTHTASAEKTS